MSKLDKEKFSLFGVVHPVRASLSINSEKPDWLTIELDAGSKYEILYKLNASHLSAEIFITDRKETIADVHNILKSLLQRQLDARGFDAFSINRRLVMGLDLEIHTIIEHQNNLHFSFVDGQEIFPNDDAPELPSNFRVHAIQNNSLALALCNFREAIKQYDETAFFCRRAKEAIASEFRLTKLPENKVSPLEWDKMCQALNLSETSVSRNDASDIIRHGRMVPQTGAQRAKDLRYAWEVIRRFGCYLENGSIKLNEADFPLF